MYDTVRTIHNSVGGLTLLLTLVAAVTLLVAARTATTGPALVLRGTLVAASLQGALGILLLIWAAVAFGIAYLGGLWIHFLLGLASVGLVSAVSGRACRAPDRDARRYGGMLLGIVVVVLLAYLAGQYKWG